MPHTPEWKFILVDSKDLSEIGELHEARSKTLNLALNTPGSASFSYSFEGVLAAEIQVISTGVMAYRRGSDDTYHLIWSGYINEINEDVNNDMMSVSVVGWFERLNKRIARADVIYKSKYDSDIIISSGMSTASGSCASGIMHLANLTSSISGYTITGDIPVVSGSSPNTPTWITPGSYSDEMRLPTGTPSGASLQDLSIKQDASFGEAIMTLVNQENGCDIEVDAKTRALNVYGKKGSVKSEVWFGYNWGPENVKEFSNQISTDQLANYLVGRANATTPQSIQTDEDSLNTYGLFEDSLNITLKTSSTSVLAYYTAAEYEFRRRPFESRAFTPYPYTVGSSVPEPFVDYNIGDIVKFRAVREPRVDITGSFRVFGISVSAGDDGSETINSLVIYSS
jgi:hypothetical protein